MQTSSKRKTQSQLAENPELIALRCEVARLGKEVARLETERKRLMDIYLKGPRKERGQNKVILDAARHELFERELLHAAAIRKVVELEVRHGFAPKERLDDAIHECNRLRSAIPHEEWLVWTRSIWKFKDTESTAKTGKHPAQYSAVLPHRLVKLFSFIGDTVLDPFVGMGTTLAEAWRLERHSIGIDVNPKYVQATARRVELHFREENSSTPSAETLLELYRPVVHQGDARKMSMIPDESIDLIVAHPPYWNAVKISDLTDDLSFCDNESYEAFLGHMENVFREMGRVLRPDRLCCVVTGDVMRKVKGVTQLFPLHVDYINIARRTGFTVWDTYIWETKIRDSGGRPMMGSYPYPNKIFSQFAHNYILLFRKAIQK
jgi:DNA modification methylase